MGRDDVQTGAGGVGFDPHTTLVRHHKLRLPALLRHICAAGDHAGGAAAGAGAHGPGFQQPGGCLLLVGVGFSASLMAAVYGAQMIERHFSLSRDFNIHHIDAALVPSEFRQMTNMIDEVFLETTTSSESFNPEELKFLVDRVYT